MGNPLPGYKASVSITSSPSVPFIDETMIDAGDHKTYTIANAAKRYWDPAVTLTVQTSPNSSAGWTTITSGFTAQNVGGIVIFANPVPGSPPNVRVSGSSMPVSIIARAKSVEITTTVDIVDVTDFSSGGWKTKIATLAGAQYKLGQWWIDSFYLANLNTLLVVSAYSGANRNQRFEAFAYIKDDSVKIVQNNAIEEAISFEVHGAVYAVS